jgi:hypothetical protein
MGNSHPNMTVERVPQWQVHRSEVVPRRCQSQECTSQVEQVQTELAPEALASQVPVGCQLFYRKPSY